MTNFALSEHSTVRDLSKWSCKSVFTFTWIKQMNMPLMHKETHPAFDGFNIRSSQQTQKKFICFSSYTGDCKAIVLWETKCSAQFQLAWFEVSVLKTLLLYLELLRVAYSGRRAWVGQTWVHVWQATVAHFSQSEALITYRNVWTAIDTFGRAMVLWERERGGDKSHHHVLNWHFCNVCLVCIYKGNIKTQQPWYN